MKRQGFRGDGASGERAVSGRRQRCHAHKRGVRVAVCCGSALGGESARIIGTAETTLELAAGFRGEMEPEKIEDAAGAPDPWKWAARGLFAIVIGAIAVMAGVWLFASGDDSSDSAVVEQQEKKAADEETADAAPSTPVGGGVVRRGGGSGSSGSRGISKDDVLACNRAAAAARTLPSDAPPAGSSGKGSGLIGAAASTLNMIGNKAADDARATAAYQACVAARGP